MTEQDKIKHKISRKKGHACVTLLANHRHFSAIEIRRSSKVGFAAAGHEAGGGKNTQKMK
jgi:hypothetical protein